MESRFDNKFPKNMNCKQGSGTENFPRKPNPADP